MPEALAADARVNHPRHGVGQVIADAGEFVVVRFGATIQQVLRSELTLARSLHQALSTGTFDESAETLMRERHGDQVGKRSVGSFLPITRPAAPAPTLGLPQGQSCIPIPLVGGG